MKIKKTIYFLVLSSTILLFSCKDYLDVRPDDGIYNESFWKNRNDLQNAVAGCYSSLSRSIRRVFVMSEIRSDLVDNGTSLDNKMSKIKIGLIAPDNDYVKWGNFYSTINLCNAVIKNAPKILENDRYASSADVKALTAEAYYIRSLTYFYLVRFFKDVPLILMPSDNDKIDFNIPKSSESDIINQIITDLEANKEYVPGEYSGKTLYQLGENGSDEDIRVAYSNIGRVTKAAYQMLLADVYLWNNEYKKCSDLCDLVINSEKYALIKNWYTNFYADDYNYNEHIFSVLFFNDGDPGVSATAEVSWRNDIRKFTTATGTSGNNMIPSANAFSIFSNPQDIRGEGASVATSNYSIWKWGGTNRDLWGVSLRPTSGQFAEPHWIVYRYADVMLMKAEALTEMDDYLGARTFINKIRIRAEVDTLVDMPQDKAEAEVKILEERALEFAFEGKRWFDLVRFARRNSNMKQYLIDQQTAAAAFGSVELIRAACIDELGWFYPIHRDELLKNTNLVQNSFYTR